jgi:hypothetical protein
MIPRYIFLAVIQVILMLYSVLTGWVTIAPFIKSDGHLPYPLRYWFEPTDSPAIGDDAYLSNEGAWTMKYPQWIRNYMLCYLWSCLRNPAYGFANQAGFDLLDPTNFISVGNPNIDVGDSGAITGSVYRTLTNGDGRLYFEYRKIFRWSSSLVCYIQLGWSLSSLEPGRKHLCVYIRPFVRG